LALELDLTHRLVNLDAISGFKSDFVRARRKALARKIEEFLAQVDAVKKKMEARDLCKRELEESKPTEQELVEVETVPAKKQDPVASELDLKDLVLGDFPQLDLMAEDEIASRPQPISRDIRISFLTPRGVPSLRQMCYQVCDDLIKSALLQPVSQ